MSRDRTSDEVIEDALFPYQRDLSTLQARLKILRDTARAEGRAEALADAEGVTERIAEAISSYLDDLDDPGAVDSDDLAENIVRHLERQK